MRTLMRFLIGLAIYFIIMFAVAGILVGMFHPDTPKALPSITEPFATMDISGIPTVRRYRARVIWVGTFRIVLAMRSTSFH